jgi:dihydrofolate synthase/folylpolyglutamate synthase
VNYPETLDYLFSRLPMYSRIGAAAYRKDLTNTIALCEFLGNPQQKLKCVHIAGTNGKGSVSHMLAAVLQSAGYKTGLYTSPHLKDFRERIRINGQMIDKSFVIDFTEQAKQITEKIEPSFFELTVAMAFQYFFTQEVDIAIIETGLGGRLDSTNIITPVLSVITNIGRDHMNMLGETLTEIAGEKAGIIKENIPVVIGEFNNETIQVFKKVANEKNAALTVADEKRKAMDWRWEKNMLIVEVSESHHTDRHHYKLDLSGLYQTKNILTVLESIEQLNTRGWNIPQKAIDNGLAHAKKLTQLHGRWEIIRHDPLTIVDVAHNANGMEQLLEQVELTNYRELHMVIGLSGDKPTDELLSLLSKRAHYYFTKAQIPRALPEMSLRTAAQAFGLEGQSYADVNTALESAILNAKKEDLVIICGSIFLAGEIQLPVHASEG